MLRSNTILKYKRSNTIGDVSFYWVLPVLSKSYGKWFMVKPTELPVFKKKFPSKVRITMQLLDEKLSITGVRSYTPVNDFFIYTEDKVYKNILVSSPEVTKRILEIIGILE